MIWPNKILSDGAIFGTYYDGSISGDFIQSPDGELHVDPGAPMHISAINDQHVIAGYNNAEIGVNGFAYVRGPAGMLATFQAEPARTIPSLLSH